MDDEVERTIEKLVAYCQASDWAGYDPYDALNSELVSALPFLNGRLPRIAITQALKRSPINIRPLLRVRPAQNSKAIALLLSAFLKLSRMGPPDRTQLIDLMIERLAALACQGTPYWCWGYGFAWQGRTKMVPAGAPNLVCTVFVANALLDAHEDRGDESFLSMAMSAAGYLLKELYWTDGHLAAGFAYPLPSFRDRVHNANLLAAALLCRVYSYTGDASLLEPALRVTRSSVTQQHADGSWNYGEAPSQRWIDNFHTGYNLCALRSIARDADTSEFDASLRRGFQFYRTHFIRANGTVRYFSDRTYPIDSHCVAQSIITLLTFRDIDPTAVPAAHSVFRWAMDHMWDDRGFFYYRVLRFYTIRTSYMRWSQAWMLLALAELQGETTGSMSRSRTVAPIASAEAPA